ALLRPRAQLLVRPLVPPSPLAASRPDAKPQAARTSIGLARTAPPMLESNSPAPVESWAPMLSVSQAQALILPEARPLPPEAVPLGPAALGALLAEDVVSDLDMPPYDKALMDGYAVRAADLADGRAALAVVEEITAGRVPRHALGPGQASRIM